MNSQEERELMKEADEIFRETDADLKILGIKPPVDMSERLAMSIKQLKEEQARINLSEADKELLYLGRKYKRKMKYRKYFILAAAFVMALAFGVTSIGGSDKLFEIFKIKCLDREQVQINSDEETKVVDFVNEEEVYREVEKRLKFYPVKLDYLPEGIVFQEATIYDELQGINLIYGKENEANIIYWIRPNYQESSWSKDIEDNLLEEYELKRENIVVYVKKYDIENHIRWLVLFENNGVSYSMYITSLEKGQVVEIIENLYFT